MQITIINKSSLAVPAPGAQTVAAGATRVMAGRTVGEFQETVALIASAQVQVLGTIEPEDYPPVKCVMKTPASPAGGVNTLAGNGFDIVLPWTGAAKIAPTMYFGVYQDAACTVPATTATLATAATGTIVSGSGTNMLVVTPSADGIFSCTLTDTVDETVYLKAHQHAAYHHAMEMGAAHSVVFTPV